MILCSPNLDDRIRLPPQAGSGGDGLLSAVERNTVFTFVSTSFGRTSWPVRLCSSLFCPLKVSTSASVCLSVRLSSSEFSPSRGWPLDFFSALLDFFFLLGSLRPLLVLLGPSSLAAASHRFVDDPKEGEETETEGAPTDDGEATENGDGKREGEGGLDDRSRSMEWKERERRGKGESERSGKAARRQKGTERKRG